MIKKVVVIGTGDVGQTLAKGLKSLGHDVTIASRDGKQVDGWGGKVGNVMDVTKTADLVILAIKGTAAEGVVKAINGDLSRKTVIDVCNPIADAAPENGVLKFFTSLNESLMERLQRAAPDASFVKAFNSVGYQFMVNPDFGNVRPTMFICGNDDSAKSVVSEILDKFGWDVCDMGGVESARAIEPLCILWCIPGILRGEWNHAFKLLTMKFK